MMMVRVNEAEVKKLRAMAERLDDFRLTVRLLAVVAIVTQERHDVLHAVSMAREHITHSDQVAEAMAIIAKTLAKAHRFEEAREVASQMEGMSAFWRAEAWVSIARFSGVEKDQAQVADAIPHIRSHRLRDDVRHDLKIALEKHHSGKIRSFSPDIVELNTILSRLEAFDDAHVVRPKLSSAHLRLLAKSVIDSIFAESMK